MKLGDISNKVIEKNKDNQFTETLTNSAEYGIINQREFFDKDISNEKKLRNYYVVRDNDFIYNPRISNYAPVGPIKRNKLGRSGVMSPLYYVFRTHDISEPFLEYYFETAKWHKFMKLNGDSGARSDRFAIKDAVFSTMPIPYPFFKEQQKIGSFFQTINKAVTLQQRRLDLLKKLKRGYLQQMFPAKDMYIPQLRFNEFNGDWKQCKLGEIFTERTERSGEGELISVTINSGVVKASELDRKDNSSKNKSNYKKVEIGDIAYNSMRMWQGASGYSPYKGILSPAYTVITPKSEVDSEFFAYDFKRFNMIQTFKRNSQGLTSDTWNLKFPTLKSIKLMVPFFDEQIKISSFFNQIDNMILLQQSKIGQLNKIKQAYLQKLFP